MLLVEVLMDLPLKNLYNTYTYAVPANMEADVSFGKRVMVEFGKRKVEAFIVAIRKQDDSPEKSSGIKKIIKVLDPEPLFDIKLYRLARWMAEEYLCPVSIAIKAMLPPLLGKKRGKIIIPLITEQDRSSLTRKLDNRDFWARVWQEGELSLQEANKYLNNEQVQALEEEGLICISGIYSGYRSSSTGYVYQKGDFNFSTDLPVLKKKAPRQAEAMELIQNCSPIDKDVLDKIIPASSIKSLISKGFIKICRKSYIENVENLVLNDEQEKAIASIGRVLSVEESQKILLFGVTGSGKTEVYIRAAEMSIEKGKNVIVLVPEIALTRHLMEAFSRRIKHMTVIHSRMPAGERYNAWKRIQRGEFNLVLGTRLAVFSPLPDLGLIIIDEEQESTYKQEESPRYHACEVARKRAKTEKAHVIMGSATPSVETFYSAMKGQLKLLTLKKRVGEAKMPVTTVQDMRKSGKWTVISKCLEEKIRERLEKQEQTILFVNRRGYSPMTICRHCGSVVMCPHCSVGLTFHHDSNRHICHYCNYQKTSLDTCPSCGSRQLQLIGIGTQRLEEEVKLLFPAARTARLDLDSSKKTGVQKRILAEMKNGEIDILVGTQMVAKGLDFPNVSLVGIVDADSMLNLPDFRAGERCFQLIVQAAGRAGRGSKEGEVVIQTYDPENTVIRMSAHQDYPGFFTEEIKLRHLLNYPPFSKILRVVISSEDEKLVQDGSRNLGVAINEIIDAREETIEVLGPAPCPINKIRKRYRWQLLVKCENMLLLKSIASFLIQQKFDRELRIEVEITPLITM